MVKLKPPSLEGGKRIEQSMSEAPNSDSRIEPIQVLLVEDNSVDAEFVQWLLARCGTACFQVTRVESLSAALPIVQNVRCDVVLLDLSLPDSLGFASLREFALAAPFTPIVVLTGLDEESAVLQAIGHGAQDYLVKGRNDMRLLSRSMRCAIERKAFEARLAERAHYDPLTGLANRTLFNDRLVHALARARRVSQRVGLMFIDLDGFKAINDTMGHQIGDQVLKLIAERLRCSVRESETIARFGGDEFTILIEPLEDAVAAAATTAERILDGLQTPLSVASTEVRVTPSIGIALFPDHAKDADTLLRHADAAMFRAKSLGRNNFQFHDANPGYDQDRRFQP